MESINWLAVIVAGISSFMVGGIWYSPSIFGKTWMLENKLSDSQIQEGNKGKIFGFTFLFSLVMSANLALFLQGSQTDLGRGMAIGFHAGVFTFCAITIHSLFELKSWKLILINAGYSVVSLTLMGAILGIWR
ncbi:MAG: DUF1761 domain-containing protein [Bacteroidota bacterium]